MRNRSVLVFWAIFAASLSMMFNGPVAASVNVTDDLWEDETLTLKKFVNLLLNSLKLCSTEKICLIHLDTLLY